jgi:hypothetical protein
MNDILYLLIGPAIVAIIAWMYTMKEREWVSLTKEEIYHLWDTNSEKFGSVEDFGRALERAIQEKNNVL